VCELPDVRLVGISGGEPFVERRGLTLAMERLAAARKSVVLYTSGVWARTSVSAWARQVIGGADCVFLSTDAQHAQQLPRPAFVRAARTIVEEGAGLVVQVIRDPDMVTLAESLVEEAFGQSWPDQVDLSLTPALPYGRGRQVFAPPSGRPGAEFGPCTALAAPVVRYDGKMTACCNEVVITGGGPDLLRRRADHASDVQQALRDWSDDDLLQAVEHIGYGPLTELPEVADLQQQVFGSVCDLCWRATPRIATSGARTAAMLRSIVATRRET
jgi:hypothetical protein